MCLSSLFALLLTSNGFSHYKGALNSSDRPLALIGKGITFDSGGITLKQGEGMKLMRSDMGGAAAVASAALAIAKLKIPYVSSLCRDVLKKRFSFVLSMTRVIG